MLTWRGLVMDKQQILTSAMQWMHARGWRSKLAKSRSGQSLFEHSLVEVDVLLDLQPILAEARHYGLTKPRGTSLRWWLWFTTPAKRPMSGKGTSDRPARQRGYLM